MFLLCKAQECPYNKNNRCQRTYLTINEMGGCSFIYKRLPNGQFDLDKRVLTPEYRALVQEMLEERKALYEGTRVGSTEEGGGAKEGTEGTASETEGAGTVGENSPDNEQKLSEDSGDTAADQEQGDEETGSK